MVIVIAVVVIALLLGVLGAIIEGLLWLLFIGIILLAGAFVYGAIKGRSSSTT